MAALFAMLLGVSVLAAQAPVTGGPPEESGSLAAAISAGSEALARGDNVRAEQAFRQALALDLSSIPLRNNLALSLTRMGRNDEAIALYQEALRLRPGDAITMRNLGAAYFRAHRFAQAAPLLQSAADQTSSFQTLELAGLAWFAMDHYPEAIQDLQGALRLQPNDLETLTALGRAYLHAQNYAAMTDVFEQLMAAHPASAEAHVMLATAYDKLFREEDAIREFEAAERVDPTYPGLHSGLGLVYFRTEDFAASARQMQEELSRHPEDPIANCTLGRILLRQGQPTQAIVRFDAALAVNPSYSDALRERGEASLTLHQPAEAVVFLRRAVALAPMDARAHYTLGTALRESGSAVQGNREREKAAQILAAAHGGATAR